MVERKRVRVKGVLIFESLWEKSKIDEKDTPKYGITLLVDKESEDAARLQDAIDEVATEFFNGKIPKQAKTYLSDGDVDKEQDYYNGYYYLRARSGYAPEVIVKHKDGSLDPDPELNWKDIYYDGIEGYVTINLYGYDNRQNKGVGYGLGNVLVLADTGTVINIGSISALEDFRDLL